MNPFAESERAAEQARLERERERAEREQRRQEAKQRMKQRHKVSHKLRQRTAKGQPVMKNQVQHLLSKIRADVASDKRAARKVDSADVAASDAGVAGEGQDTASA